MAVKIMKWSSPWTRATALPPATTRKFKIKIVSMKLEGVEEIESFNDDDGKQTKMKLIAIKVKWKGESKSSGLFVPFHRTTTSNNKQRKDMSSYKVVKKLGEAAIEWYDEFQNICCFTEVSGSSNQNMKMVPWDVSFHVLYGDSKAKMFDVGRVVLNVAEMASKLESEVEENLPITLHIARASKQATLQVKLNFAELRDFQDSAGLVPDSNEPRQIHVGMADSDESATFEAGETSLVIESGSSPSSETRFDSVKKLGWWKRRRLSLRPVRAKAEPLFKRTRSFNIWGKVEVDSQLDSVIPITEQKLGGHVPSAESSVQNEGSCIIGSWEAKELQSRDGQTKLKSNVYFASFDQRSDKAAGESACTALVVVTSHWLHSNRDATPTRSEFDNLIVQGSSEWRKLCENESYIKDFPNMHFDLETVLHAAIRPIAISRDQSFVGFFGPEKFECLKGVMSFDQIWDKISSIAEQDEFEPRVYIISWNDHFFVLKVESNAYYIIDTLGERLFEGCDRAYILRFDDSCTMYERIAEEEPQSDDPKADKRGEKMICSGKECCREFLKRFLAAIPLKELEDEEEKETVSYFSLHHRLQIEFNFCYLSSSLCSSSTSSPFSSSATSTPSYL